MAAADFKIKIMEEKIITMQDLWLLLQPSATFDTRGRYEKCLSDWSRMDASRQKRVYQLLQLKKTQGGLNPNPYYALNDAMQEDEQRQAKALVLCRQQTLSFADYYAKFGTTEEVDGWKRQFLPEEQKTIYVK